jgi:hypothetical protein
MLESEQMYIQGVELTQLAKQIVYMVDGGEDVCCAIDQWGMKWANVNEYRCGPNLNSDGGHIFTNQFVTIFS